MKNVISFPHLGNYYIPIYNLLSNIIDNKTCEIMIPKKITNKTLEIGSKVSPEFICIPFKYNMGNYIESLDNGANVLFQAGGGCRYGYYAELQEQILKDLGYEFKFIPLLDYKGINLLKIYKLFKGLNFKLSFLTFIYYLLLTVIMIKKLDDFEKYIRDNKVYEKTGKFNIIHKKLLNELKNINTIYTVNKVFKKYNNELKNIKLEYSDCIKIGIVGELFTSMEPFSTFNLEDILNEMNVKIKRYTTVTYLLFQKNRNEKKLLKKSSKYLTSVLGADGTESIAHTLEMIDEGYDGIIHIKPFSCTPEVNAIPILQKISNDKNIPIIYLTFDTNTSKTGLMTRIEAFYDMIKMKKEKILCKDVS